MIDKTTLETIIDMDNKKENNRPWIYSIDFRTADYDDAHHVTHEWDNPIDGTEALEYIRHWALDLVINLKINGKTTSWNYFRTQPNKP